LCGLIVFCIATLVISAWQLEVNSVVVFLQEFFTLDILGFALIWAFAGMVGFGLIWAFADMVAAGARVHSCSGVVS